jgi:hypothetical protein
MRPKRTTGIVVYTKQDALGFGEPLARYVDLPSGILGQFYNLANGTPAASRYFRERLTTLFHETQEFSNSRMLLHRPEYQHRHGINHEAIYRKSPGAALLLYRYGIYDDLSIRWINNSHLMNFEQGAEPSQHDHELAIVAASIELMARKDRGFITHIDILRTASEEAQDADSPLSIPVYKLEFKFKGFEKPQIIERTHVKPDFLFGLPVSDGGKFFAVEYDRHTEDMEPTKSLKRMSWLKKILMYSAITKEPTSYKSYLGIPNLRILAVFQGPKRQSHFNELVHKHARFPAQFASTIVPPIDFLMSPRVMPEIYRDAVWTKADGTKFSLREEVG